MPDPHRRILAFLSLGRSFFSLFKGQNRAPVPNHSRSLLPDNADRCVQRKILFLFPTPSCAQNTAQFPFCKKRHFFFASADALPSDTAPPLSTVLPSRPYGDTMFSPSAVMLPFSLVSHSTKGRWFSPIESRPALFSASSLGLAPGRSAAPT